MPNDTIERGIKKAAGDGNSVNLYRFTHFLDFPSGSIFTNLLVGEASPSPFERHLRYRLHDFPSFCKKQNFLFLSLQQKSDDRKITKLGTPTFSGIAAIITLLSATNRSVARSCHLSQGEVVQRKLWGTPRSSR